MYGIYTYIWHRCMVNVGKYSTHGAFGHIVKCRVNKFRIRIVAWFSGWWFESNVFMFTPKMEGRWLPSWLTHIFSDGLKEKTPTGFLIFNFQLLDFVSVGMPSRAFWDLFHGFVGGKWGKSSLKKALRNLPNVYYVSIVILVECNIWEVMPVMPTLKLGSANFAAKSSGWKATMIDFDFAVEIKHKKVLEISI